MRKVKDLFRICIALTVALPTMACAEDDKVTTTEPHRDDYVLVWQDEFDHDGAPDSCWTFEEGFVRNEELQWYSRDNARVENGCLVLEARRASVPNPNFNPESADWKENRDTARYTSACVTTRLSKVFQYGRFEVRAKIPVSRGAWPAIWLLGNQWDWPMNGEIDILEYYIKNGVPSILVNACWSSDKQWDAVWNSAVTPFSHFTEKDPDWATKFHLWRMDWTPRHILIYLDDELLNDIDLSKTNNQGYDGNFENPFNTKVKGFGDYLLLNLAVGSNGGIPDDAAFPLRYYIDYVRVWQKK